MKIKLNLQIFIFILIFILSRQIKLYGLLMFFAFIHELGHMVVGILLGFKPSNFEIMPFGVSVGFKINLKNYNKRIKRGTMLCIKKIIIALAGPITNLLFIIIYSIFDITFFGIEREYIIYSNILIGIFNLIPIYPLDGGRIVKEVIHILYGIKESYINTHLISNITIIILTIFASISILYLKNIAILFSIIYLWILVIFQNKKYKNKIEIFEKYTNL